jgi:hypothetical protein
MEDRENASGQTDNDQNPGAKGAQRHSPNSIIANDADQDTENRESNEDDTNNESPKPDDG